MSQQTRNLTRTADEEREVQDLAQDSLEVTSNAKRELSWSIKVYGKDATEVAGRTQSLLNVLEQDLLPRARRIAREAGP
jgi:hypothetical protein